MGGFGEKIRNFGRQEIFKKLKCKHPDALLIKVIYFKGTLTEKEGVSVGQTRGTINNFN